MTHTTATYIRLLFIVHLLPAVLPMGCDGFSAKSIKPNPDQPEQTRTHSSQPNKSDEDGPGNDKISCIDKLSHSDAVIDRAYREAFSMFGAFLLKYQEILQKGQDVQTEFNKIPILSMYQNGKYFDTPVNDQGNGDLVKIDKGIVLPAVRNIWQAWCQHPDNFLSWLLYPVYHIEANNILELSQNSHGFYYTTKPTMIMWGDDGFWMMSQLLGISIKGSPGESDTWKADPNKWLIKLDGDKAITK